MIAVLPWLFGFVGVGVGYPLVGDTVWLLPFAIVPVVAGFVAIWPSKWRRRAA